MTTQQAIRHIDVAICELRDYSASQNPFGAAETDQAIANLEEVREALQKHKLEYMPFVA